MKKIYEAILKKAIPFYKRGREGDVQHIKWLFRVVPKYISPKEVDFDFLMPVVILHDVGYSAVPKGSNPFDLGIRKFHSEEGAKIARQILTEVSFPENKISRIEELVLKHDNWAFGDSFASEPVLRIFNNFDFMWMASKQGFDIVRKFTGKSPVEFYEQIKSYQKGNESQGRKWYSAKIQGFYEEMMKAREKEINEF